MKVSVISFDGAVWALCREVVSEALPPGRIARVDPGTRPPESDLYIWDYEPAFNGLLDLASTARVLYLVHPKDLESFRRNETLADANIVLKPVKRVALRAFASSLAETAAASTIDTLRSERDELLKCVLETNLRLQTYDRERTNFLGRAVHDFQAPLTAILGFCGLLNDGAVGQLTPDQKEILRRVSRNAKRLSDMAVGMLQLAVSNNQQKLKLQPGNIRDCIESVLHELAPLGRSKNISMMLTSFEPPEKVLWFERSKIEQVLTNLIENACQFTPRNGNVEVRGAPFFWDRRLRVPVDYNGEERRQSPADSPNAYRIDVRDSGPGVPAQYVTEIFEEFRSYRGAQDRAGTGLGLAICKMLVEQHRGRIWAEADAGGALFSIALPYQRLAGLN